MQAITRAALSAASRSAHQAAWIRSADAVLDHVFALIGGVPGSALDLGCGQGAWLAALHEYGVEDLVGVEREPIAEHPLAPADYIRHDLTRPLDLGRIFELVLGLEVGEHLDGGDVSAEIYVGNLCRHGSIVLFSAAIPGQGGEHHVNEQWPEYWARLFRRHGFAAADPLRLALWDDERVLWWYRQNAVIYFDPGSARAAGLAPHVSERVPAIVHPLCYRPRA